ncbi:hypothetical protein [Sporosarcina saromensis]|nr:hypothetical protein [Sporosarcina saromensis]
MANDISYEKQDEMIVQGGGEFRETPRCAGKWITLQRKHTYLF